MKILYLAPDPVPSPKGAAVRIRRTVETYRELGHDVELFTPASVDLKEANFLERMMAYRRAAAEWLEGRKADLIQFRSIWEGIPAVARARRVGAHQTAQDDKLLRVFQAEDRHVGPAVVEKLGNNGDHPPKMPRPMTTAKMDIEVFDVDPDSLVRLPARIHLFDTRREDDIDPAPLFERVQVAFERARILLEVFAGRKLRGIDEDRDGAVVAVLSGGVDQGEVAVVERAHRRHEGQSPAHSPPVLGQRLHRGDRANEFHQGGRVSGCQIFGF